MWPPDRPDETVEKRNGSPRLPGENRSVGLHSVRSAGGLLAALAAEDADLRDLGLVALALGDDQSADALLADLVLGEALVLQAALEGVTGLERLSVLVEHALDDLGVLGQGHDVLVTLLALPLVLEEGHGALVRVHLGDNGPDFRRQGDDPAEDQAEAGPKNLAQHGTDSL